MVIGDDDYDDDPGCDGGDGGSGGSGGGVLIEEVVSRAEEGVDLRKAMLIRP